MTGVFKLAGAEGGTRRGVPRLMRGGETAAGVAAGTSDPSLPGAASRFCEGPKAKGLGRGAEWGLLGEGEPKGKDPGGLIGEGR